METMAAIGYIRVSTTGQVDEGVSLDVQRAKIEAWCGVNDYELIDVFTDAGISGKRADNRPGLQDALQAACKTRGAALIVYSLSRLARSTKDAISIVERLDKAGADLVSISEKIDTTTAAGKMVFRMLAVLAEFERDLVSERTVAALAHMRSQGKRISRTPFGFDLGTDGTTLVENSSEQVVIDDILKMRARGLSFPKIARSLTERGIPTKRGNGGTQWNQATINGLCRRHGDARAKVEYGHRAMAQVA
jgi:DNA invertase Pin-like site-specific DNA recombinase